MKRRALVLGGTGYTGSWFIKKLIVEGYSVVALSRSRRGESELDVSLHEGVTWISEIASVASTMDTNRFDVVVDLSGYAVSDHEFGDVDPLVSAHITASTQAAEIARMFGCLLIVARSYWQFVPCNDATHINLYAAVQSSLDPILSYYAEKHGLAIVNLYMADSYGPDDSRGKIIPSLLSAALTGEPVFAGAPCQVVAPVHIIDSINGLWAILRSGEGFDKGTIMNYQLLPKQTISVGELVTEIEIVTKRQIIITWNARPAVRENVLSIEPRFSPPPLWVPKIHLPEGLYQIFTNLAMKRGRK